MMICGFFGRHSHKKYTNRNLVLGDLNIRIITFLSYFCWTSWNILFYGKIHFKNQQLTFQYTFSVIFRRDLSCTIMVLVIWGLDSWGFAHTFFACLFWSWKVTAEEKISQLAWACVNREGYSHSIPGPNSSQGLSLASGRVLCVCGLGGHPSRMLLRAQGRCEAALFGGCPCLDCLKAIIRSRVSLQLCWDWCFMWGSEFDQVWNFCHHSALQCVALWSLFLLFCGGNRGGKWKSKHNL